MRQRQIESDRRPRVGTPLPGDMSLVNQTVDDNGPLPMPALGEPGKPVVQVNVDEGATDQYSQTTTRRTLSAIVRIVIGVLLAFPVLWGLVETVMLAGILGP